MTTFEVGAPDWGVRSQLDVVAYNQAIPASPTTLVMDVARYRWSLIQLAGAIGAGGNCNLAATWQDVNGVTVTSAALGNMSCGQSSAAVVGYLRHLGPQVTFTLTNGGGGMPTVRIIHTNDPPPHDTPCTPNVGGRLLFYDAVVLGVGANASRAVKGTGGFGTGIGQLYCGPAWMSVQCTAGTVGEARINDSGGAKLLHVAPAPVAGGGSYAWGHVWIPAEDWSVQFLNGGTGQTIEVAIQAR